MPANTMSLDSGFNNGTLEPIVGDGPNVSSGSDYQKRHPEDFEPKKGNTNEPTAKIRWMGYIIAVISMVLCGYLGVLLQEQRSINLQSEVDIIMKQQRVLEVEKRYAIMKEKETLLLNKLAEMYNLAKAQEAWDEAEGVLQIIHFIDPGHEI